MKITLKKTFLKDIQKVNEPQKSQVKSFLEALYADASILESSYNIKKLQGDTQGNFFRIRFGDYRLVYEKKEDELIIYRILHRKESYRYFP
ncbi:MAG: type II toxin-antitoxin system mRNA interferase toxin, RelE/StbE family [Desulfamplus sp.]|nr:type II toxin-antitoxin system mRNA interferase toxin, RelE/StbE family [Desulfamplus sp.]